MSTILKRHSKGIYCRQKGTVLIESTQVRWFPEQSGGRMDLEEVAKGSQSYVSEFKEDHQVQVHSDQMVLMMVRQEVGPDQRWPKTLMGEFKMTLGIQGT